MKASKLKVGGEYTIIPTPKYRGYGSVTVLDNRPVPDGQENQRCVLVEHAGQQFYILPRLLDDGTMVMPSQPQSQPQTSPAIPDHTPFMRKPITDPMDERLDQYRPDPKIVRAYVGRTIHGMTDTDLLMHFWRERDTNGYSQNVMLVGDTQSGKTMLVNVLACLIAKEMGYAKPLPVLTLSGSAGVTDYDLLGQPTTFTDNAGHERVVWLPGILELAARVPVLLYLDEVNMMPERVTSTLHPVCDDRRTFLNRAKAVNLDGEFLPEQTKMNTGTWVIGTYNDGSAGYRGAGMLNAAFSNRFRHLPWGYDDDVEKKLIKSESVRLLGSALREARSLRSITTPVGTKALQRLWDDAARLGAPLALWAFTGSFPESERSKVQAIITDRSVEMLLTAELTHKP